jgi:anthranilate phosphoribosyltransferase
MSSSNRSAVPARADRQASPDGPPHDFARFIRTIGRGATLSRPLTREEAREAMGMILRGDVAPEQLGAMMIVLRYRKETPEELAGFVEASRALMACPSDTGVMLDWPSYADRHKQLPYFILAARLLADEGVRVLIHGIAGEGAATTPKALAAIGVTASADADDAARRLDAGNLAYLPLESLCPPLLSLFALRPVLGLRSPANTFARMLNPFAARHQMQGVFHPNYLATHQAAAQQLGQPYLAAFKGGGGEVQRNPEKPCHVVALIDGAPGEQDWPALAANARYPWREEALDPALLHGLWDGTHVAEAPVAAVTGTVAIALRLLGKADSAAAADAAARDLWRGRRKRNR